ncbi:MAG: hypothetical protein Q4F07_10010 [Bacteroidales bacterium]|nr:hypothetical protein [Bacteroidales bacterium]
MAISKADAEALVRFSALLKEKHDDILAVKAAMDNVLNSFVWADPVGQSFVTRYHEELKPIETKLVPNLESYSSYLDQEASIISEYGQI